MPPIMGAGVFILATLIEIDYLKIALINVIPALIYFIFVLYMVDLEAVRSGLKGLPVEEIPKISVVLKQGWHFFLPVHPSLESQTARKLLAYRYRCLQPGPCRLLS